jgi:hypothetical protein
MDLDSVADPDRCFFDPWIRGPGWKKVQARIRDEHPGSYFSEHQFFLLKLLLNSLMRIRDLVNPGSRMEKNWIWDPG